MNSIKKNSAKTYAQQRYFLVPHMYDYDRIVEDWVPYLMLFHKPEIKYTSVSTDQYGFRKTLSKNGENYIDYTTFKKNEGNKGIILGSSSAFGVGATHDRYTIPSVLNKETNIEWFNFGGRAYNSTQEMILFLLHFPSSIKKMVIFSGANNLSLSYLGSDTSCIYNSFFLQSFFKQAMEVPPKGESIGVKKSLRLFLRELRHKFIPRSKKIVTKIDTQYENILACFRRDLQILKKLSIACKFDLYFVFQPLACWLPKNLTKEEELLFSILDALSMNWITLSSHFLKRKDDYLCSTRQICEENEVPFFNMNNEKLFTNQDWLFVDRIHLTDHGYQLAPDFIKKECKL